MNSLREAAQYAWFADLAYVDWSDAARGSSSAARDAAIAEAHAAGRAPERSDADGTLTGPALATTIFGADRENWHLAHHHGNHPESGFAAALFVREHAGARDAVLAIRGTDTADADEFARDFFAAGLQEIGGLGLALSQTVSLVNYMRVLRAPAATAVPQLQLMSTGEPPPAAPALAADGRIYWLAAAPSASGAGLLSADQPLAVTGHSLGGHLASLAVRLYPEQFTQAVSFNAAGFDPIFGLTDTTTLVTGLAGALGSGGVALALQIVSALADRGEQLTDSAIAQLFGVLPELTPAMSFIDLAAAGRIVSLVGEDEHPGDDGAVVASIITGIPASPRREIAIEVNSHSMSQLVDALAVQAAFARIDPALDAAAANRLVALASARGDAAFEALVEALGRLYLGPDTPPLPTAATPGIAQWFAAPQPYASRGALHARLSAIAAAIDAHGPAQVVALDTLAAAELAARARTGSGYRQALHELHAFAVVGGAAPPAADIPAFEEYSEAYWGERAALLAHLLEAHLANRADGAGMPYRLATHDLDYIDERRGLGFAEVALEVPPQGLPASVAALRARRLEPVAEVRFAAGIAAAGGAADDRLYGNAFANTLSGGGGADYLDGGAHEDWLYHNDLDNAEDDARDRLAGGAGFDRYHVGHGDVVADSDGAGAVFAGPELIALAGSWAHSAGQVWRNAAIDAGLYRDGADARIALFGRSAPLTVTLANFRPGDLGIVLADAAAPAAPGALILGSFADDRLNADGALSGAGGDDRIEGLDGDDDLFGGTQHGPWGADQLLGGAGHDYLDSATLFDLGFVDQRADDEGDWMDGGAGDDVLVGNGGADQLYGGTDRDFLAGRGGDDVAHGGPGDDVLAGGGGDDLLIGGLGDDIVLGGFDVWATPHRDWSATAMFDATGRQVDVHFSGVVFGANPPAADADHLYGGGGRDFLNGGNGDDFLDGGEDHDHLFGWRGDDRLFGGAGDDFLAGDTFGLGVPGGAGNDLLDGGDGADELHGEGGEDRLLGDGGHDRLFGGGGNDSLYGGDGNDRLAGGDDADNLDGGAGDDVLDGDAGADVLDGGPGDDVLDGGSGHDVYVYRIGEGHDRVRDAVGYDTLVIEGVLDPERFATLGTGSMQSLHFSSDSSITLENWGTGGIDRLVFGTAVIPGGETLSAARLLQPADTAAAAGENVYHVLPDAAAVALDAAQGLTTLVLGEGIGVADIGGVVDAADRWQLEFGGRTLTVDNWAAGALERFVFTDGTELDHAAVDARARHAPRPLAALADQHAISGTPFGYTLPADAFVDVDANDSLHFAAALATGADLPPWLAFDAATRRFSGMPPAAASGRSIELRVTATDGTGLAASSAFFIDVLAPRAPGARAEVAIGALGAADGVLTPTVANLLAALNGTLSPAQFDALTTPIDVLAGAGDLNADGYADLIRFRGPEPRHGDPGHVAVLFGAPGGWSSLPEPAALDGSNGLLVTGAGRYEVFNVFGVGLDAGPGPQQAVQRGDIDGDGIDDLVLAPGWDFDRSAPLAGGARVLLGGTAAAPASVAFETLPARDLFGPALADATLAPGFLPSIAAADLLPGATIGMRFAGDVNGDGIADAVIDDPAGAIFLEPIAGLVLFGHGTPRAAPLSLGELDGTQGFRVLADLGFNDDFAPGGAARGAYLRALGDVDGDGFDDIGLGTITFSFSSEEHYAAVLHGAAHGHGGTLAPASLDGDDGMLVSFLGGLGLPYAGLVTGAGDVNGDGYDDLIVTSEGVQAAHLLYGAPRGSRPVVHGSPHDDVLVVAAAGAVYSGAGDDVVRVHAAAGDVSVDTGSGRDRIVFGTAPGEVPGSFAPGSTFELRGGQGEDVYVIYATSGGVRIRVDDPLDATARAQPGYVGNRLELGVGYDRQQLVNRLGSLWLDFGPERAAIHLASLDPADVLGGPRDIERIAFADGTVLDFAELVAAGFEIDGTPGADTLLGTDLGDRLRGHAGDDELRGGGGDDVLDGGAGDDVYRIGPGDGHDVIVPGAGSDRVQWDAGVSLEALSFAPEGMDLVVTLPSDDRLTLRQWFAGAADGVASFGFADGSSVDLREHLPRAPRALPVALQQLSGHDTWVLDVGALHFEPAWPGDTLSFSVAPETLPAWLAFDAASGRLTGTPADVDAGEYAVTVHASDPRGASAALTVTLTVEAALNRIAGTRGADWLVGTAGADDVSAGGGADRIETFGGDDRIAAGDGDDIIDAGHGNNRVHAHNGNDTIRSGDGDNDLHGGYGDDTITAGAGDDTIDGYYGDDAIDAGDGDNVIEGGPGDDRISAGAGDDRISGGSGADVIDAGDGHNAIAGGNDDDRISSGAGDDRIDGGYGDDRIVSGAGNDVIDGYYGDDLIEAGAGDNRIDGGPGADRITAGAGHDHIDGGSGADIVDAGDGDNVIAGGNGDDSIRSGSGDDRIHGGYGNDTLAAGAGNDIIDGYYGDDLIDAGTGDNVVEGGPGDDRISAGDGDDVLRGGHGDDTLLGGAGANRLEGGFGNDRYVFSSSGAADLVHDLGGAGDSLHFAHPGMVAAALWFTRDGDDLDILVSGVDNTVTVRDWYRQPRYRIERIESVDARALDIAGVERLVEAMAAFAPPSGAFEPASLTTHDTLAAVLATAWQDAA